jgi:hypothetical protein
MNRRAAIACVLGGTVASAVEEHLRNWKPGKVVPLAATLHHVQGIEIHHDSLWVSSVDAKSRKGYLSRLDRNTGKLLTQVEVQEGECIHPGGISRDGDWIWVPVAEYRRASSTVMQKRDHRTLQLLSSFAVTDHIGCVAVIGHQLLGGNWDSRTFYRWTPKGTQLDQTPNPQPTSYQDLKYVDGKILGCGGLGRDAGAIDWLEPSTLKLTRRVLAHRTDRGALFTREGIAWNAGRLYLLPEDDPSRLFEFSELR